VNVQIYLNHCQSSSTLEETLYDKEKRSLVRGSRHTKACRNESRKKDRSVSFLMSGQALDKPSLAEFQGNDAPHAPPLNKPSPPEKRADTSALTTTVSSRKPSHSSMQSYNPNLVRMMF
jgi:hypothetical protein